MDATIAGGGENGRKGNESAHGGRVKIPYIFHSPESLVDYVEAERSSELSDSDDESNGGSVANENVGLVHRTLMQENNNEVKSIHEFPHGEDHCRNHRCKGLQFTRISEAPKLLNEVTIIGGIVENDLQLPSSTIVEKENRRPKFVRSHYKDLGPKFFINCSPFIWVVLFWMSSECYSSLRLL